MQPGLLLKISFWMIVIGIAALLTPNPAWPELAARFVLALGVALAVTALVLPFFRRGEKKDRKTK